MDAFLAIVQRYQPYGLLAFFAVVFLTPLAMRAAHHFGVLDIPDQKLKPHARPTPYLGGAAIAIGWAAALIAAMASGACAWQRMLPILLGGLIMSVLGLIDDVRTLSPKVRLFVGAFVIIAVLASTGTGVRSLDALVFGVRVILQDVGITLPVIPQVLTYISVGLSAVLGTFIVLGACNSTNLIDGLDGLCSGVTAIISLGFFVLAAQLAAWNYSPTDDQIRLTLAVAMVGAALGFLPWNFNPAKIFMGDAGSVLLGYNCGMLILLFAERHTVRWVIAALMIFALPVFDTALAMLRRWRAGRSIFEGDRSHFYDQLVQRGFTVRQTVLICYGLTLLYGLLGLLLIWFREGGLPVIRTRYAVLLYIGVVATSAFLAWRAGLMTPENARQKRTA